MANRGRGRELELSLLVVVQIVIRPGGVASPVAGGTFTCYMRALFSIIHQKSTLQW